MKSKKCVSVGDCGVGKTSMLVTYTTKLFSSEIRGGYWHDNFNTSITVNGNPIIFELLDTAGPLIRPLIYPHTDVVLICFSLLDASSFENVLEKWAPEVSHFCPQTPIILVGTKLDLRDDKEIIDQCKVQGVPMISHKQGEDMATKINAFKYLECSSLIQKGLQIVFEEAMSAVFAPKVKPTGGRRCSLL